MAVLVKCRVAGCVRGRNMERWKNREMDKDWRMERSGLHEESCYSYIGACMKYLLKPHD
jgi:hypothetical protein